MLRKMVGLSMVALSVASGSSSAATPSPADESAMNAMKFTADVLGVKLGMSAAEAKSLIQSAIPNAKFVEYIDKATNQSAGWAATPGNCAVPHSITCDETIDVRQAAGKVWFVSRDKRYDRTKNRDVPTVQITQQSLAEKYGVLVKLGNYSRGLFATHSFTKGSGAQPYGITNACGGNSVGDIPTSFSPSVAWYYSISAAPDFRDPTFLGSLKVTLADCQYMFDVLNNKAMSDAAAEKAARDRDAAKGIKPKL